MELDANLRQRVGKIVNYIITNPIDEEELLNIIEELVNEYEHLEEKLTELEKEIEENFKPIPVAEQCGISEKDFV